MTQPGGKPRLVAGRGNGEIWNVCPAFSPDGTMLAFGRKDRGVTTISIVAIANDGAIAPRASLKVSDASKLAPCPKWSSDSSRVAYLGAQNKIIVRGLAGSILRPRDGDPTKAAFEPEVSRVVAPTGGLVARQSMNGPDCKLVVSRRDGSRKRVIEDFPCSYAIAGWSPDGRRLLVMRDLDGIDFGMVAISVHAPFAVTTVVEGVRVNHPRSWPGYGDVSWQPARASGR